jgi:single-stranded-DNA-specific exonuclease
LKYRWVFRETPDENAADTLVQELKIPRSLAKVLSSRGLQTAEDARQFFAPELDFLHDPFLMDGMERAVERIEQAIRDKELIWIHGDYDVDGTTSTAMTLQFLREIGARAEYYIPERMTEGYGLSNASVDKAVSLGATLLVAVDCGITSNDTIAYANSRGMEVIICDHHEPGDVLPDAYAILDPIKPGCPYPFKSLAACGVAFKLIQALCAVNGSPERAYSYLDYVAIASAADIVPLIGENRVLVHHGLEKLNMDPRPGFKSLVDCANLEFGNLTTSSIIFGLAPRINAAGRIGDAKRAVEMMIQQDVVAAYKIAQELEQENRTRRTIDEKTFAEAFAEAERFMASGTRRSLVLYSPDWHAGVIGIVASRLVEKFQIPVVMLTRMDGFAKGSARSIKEFDIHAALKHCEGYLHEFGGHKHAAGLTLPAENVDRFREALDEVAQMHVTDDMLVPEILIDAKLTLSELSPGFFDHLRRFAPFGFSNHKPVFYSQGVLSANGVKVVGNNHLKFRALQSNFVIDAIGFNLGDKLPIAASRRPFSLVFTLEENTYNGNTAPQIRIKDIRLDD